MLAFIIGIMVTLGCAAADLWVISDFVVSSNSTMATAWLAAIALCIGLEGGPYFLGNGISSLTDKARLKTGRGAWLPTITIIASSILTLIAFGGYLVVRIIFLKEDAAAAANEDLAYTGSSLPANVILTITPFVTSVFAFLASWWTSLGGEYAHQSKERKCKKKYDKIMARLTIKEGELQPRLQEEWFVAPMPAGTTMPDDTCEALKGLKKAYADAHKNGIKSQLNALLERPNVIDPFVETLKRLLNGFVKNQFQLENLQLENHTDLSVKQRTDALMLAMQAQPQAIVDKMNPP